MAALRSERMCGTYIETKSDSLSISHGNVMHSLGIFSEDNHQRICWIIDVLNGRDSDNGIKFFRQSETQWLIGLCWLTRCAPADFLGR